MNIRWRDLSPPHILLDGVKREIDIVEPRLPAFNSFQPPEDIDALVRSNRINTLSRFVATTIGEGAVLVGTFYAGQVMLNGLAHAILEAPRVMPFAG